MKKHFFISCVLFPMFLFVLGIDVIGILFQCLLFVCNSVMKIVLQKDTSLLEIITGFVGGIFTVLFPFSYSSYGIACYALNAAVQALILLAILKMCSGKTSYRTVTVLN
jgi:hypothetical protein